MKIRYIRIAAIVFAAACSMNAAGKSIVTGKVLSTEGAPIANVTVSDGLATVLTDGQGAYSMSTDNPTGFIFISTPGNYVAPRVSEDNNMPRFFSRIEGDSATYVRDFVLKPVDNTRYRLIAQTDQHFSGRNNDETQFERAYVPEINLFVDESEAQGIPVYSVSLGDQSWDRFWYKEKVRPADAIRIISAEKCPVYYAMGNHDNDPRVPDDWGASAEFRNNVGPSYYSFNIGKTHYIILDDIVYINNGADEHHNGDRTYRGAITDTQLQWLRNDLAQISDKCTPIVIGAHIPFYSFPDYKDDGTLEVGYRLDNMKDLEDVLRGFNNITLLSGHTHQSYTVDSPNLPGCREYNLASVCATWWWTGKDGFAGNIIGHDGTPGGYGVFDVDGDKATYRYKSVGYDPDYRFRVFDLNTILLSDTLITNEAFREHAGELIAEYAQPSEANTLLVNAWGWAPDWKIEATEDGQPLTVERVHAQDPLHIISYSIPCLNNGVMPSKGFTTRNQNRNMFRIRANSADHPVTVSVTDSYGYKSTHTVTRPKPFSTDMR